MRSLIVACVLIFSVTLLAQQQLYSPDRGYTEQSAPLYHYEPLIPTPDPHKELRIVTYNLQFCQKIEQVLEELRADPQLGQADVVLLQEVVGAVGGADNGAFYLAQELGLYALYAPAMVHPSVDQDFGNAILSRWPIEQAKKIILPHAHLIWGTHRQALFGSILHPQRRFDVVSVHLETMLGGTSKRIDQMEKILLELSSDRPVVVSGDWNTFSPAEREALSEAAEQNKLMEYTETIEGTHPIGFWNMKLDHTIGRGFDAWEAGVVSEAEGSDHWPLWFTTEL